jgi:hypothetical protein
LGEALYVTTDADGIDRSSGEHIAWKLPDGRTPHVTESDHSLVLHLPVALLEVLDERIFQAEPTSPTKVANDGTAKVSSARLITQTPWNTGSATVFALDCAEHILGDAAGATLPDGTLLDTVLRDARQLLLDLDSSARGRLGYLARLSALRRLQRERGELGDLSLGLLSDDATHDVDAFADPAYATLLPITDAVLAAIEALRHHVLPRVYVSAEDANNEREEHALIERTTPMKTSTPIVTPFGAFETGGEHGLRYEPSWTSAREAARHARTAARDRHGAQGETTEASWQAQRLGALLKGA